MGRHRVVIVGGGFGGLYAAKALARAEVDVVVLDRKNHHVFQPLLYQVATAGLNPADIASPIRHVLRHQPNTEVLLAEVERVDVANHKVVIDGGEVPYDTLVLATGATHSYFGHDAWAEDAPGLKSLEDALRIRKKIFFAYEAAEREADAARRRAWLTFVVVGGGPTGVELAGALVEIAQKTLLKDFRRIDPAEARVLLLEGGADILPAYVPELREKAKRQLEALGCEVRTKALVTKIDEDGVCVGDERIETRCVLWAAGVAASPLAKSLGVPLDRAGRVIVEPDLTVPGHPEIFVIGDLASAKWEGHGLVPGLAGAAVQGGRHAAKNIVRRLAGKPALPFHYVDKGSLATIGRAAAVADFGRIRLSGFIAWMAWLFIHILLLIGFRNRFVVMLEWAFAYVSYERGARL
ncbi:MAG TPA: NAD(P)/FAD-dependent oxidoreductase, partial [Minicystis sp.]|nr:NAD(P)/FAD-dependent oxidoreductase [Minicystis sp.]